MIFLHLCHVSGPFINCKTSEFRDGTSVPVSFYAGVTHKGKGFAFASRATWGTIVNLMCAIWKRDPLSPHGVGNYISSMLPDCSEDSHTLLYIGVQVKPSPFKRVSRQPKPFGPSKII